jgi:hypothetical protein
MADQSDAMKQFNELQVRPDPRGGSRARPRRSTPEIARPPIFSKCPPRVPESLSAPERARAPRASAQTKKKKKKKKKKKTV